MKVNTIPKITWRWLRANDSTIQVKELDKVKYNHFSDYGRESEEFREEFSNVEFGVSKDILENNIELLNWTNNIVVEKEEDFVESKTIFLDKENPQLVDLQNIHMKEGAKGYILLDYRAEEDLDFFRNTVVKIWAEKNSKLDLILIQRTGQKSLNFLSIVSQVYENAEVNLIQVELGGEKTFFNYQSNLLEENAKMDVKSAYFVDEKRELDINYLARHIAKKTYSDMIINGALKDKSKKRFVGTLDFLKGSAESIGNEEEFVTLIDEEVKSIALPLLLAHEHDVQGNHAASAGRVDEKMLNYIMSRGFNEAEAKSIVVEAKMTPTLDLIRDDNLREELKELIHEGIIRK